MNMKKITYTLLLLAVLLCGCSREDEVLPEKGMPLKLKITDAGFFSGDDAPGTRTKEQNYVTTFKAGDRIGITTLAYGYDGDNIIDGVDNIPFQFDGTSWIPESNTKINYYKNVTYIAYYPYDPGMTGKRSEQAIIDAFTPKLDQYRDYDYAASDLLVATGTADKATLTLSFKFRHAMTMVSFNASNSATGPGVDLGASLTINEYRPHLAAAENNTYKYLMKPSNQSVMIKYEFGEYYKSWFDLEAGKYYHYTLPIPSSIPLYKNKLPNLLQISGQTAYWVAPENAHENMAWSDRLNELCPSGWHVPTKDDFVAMTGLPADEHAYNKNYDVIKTVFPDDGYWSSTVKDDTYAWDFYQFSDTKTSSIRLDWKTTIRSVRCVRRYGE